MRKNEINDLFKSQSLTLKSDAMKYVESILNTLAAVDDGEEFVQKILQTMTEKALQTAIVTKEIIQEAVSEIERKQEIELSNEKMKKKVSEIERKQEIELSNEKMKKKIMKMNSTVTTPLSPPSTTMSSRIKDQGIYVGRLDITAFEDIKNKDDAKMWVDIVNELNFDSWLVETDSGLLDMGPIKSRILKEGYEGRRWHEDVLVRPYREGIDFPYIPLSALVAHGTTLYKKRCLEVIQYSLKTMTRIENTDVPVFVPDAYTTPPLKRSVEEKVRIDTTNVTSVVADAFTTPPSKRNEENTKATFANFDALNSRVVKDENLNLDSVAAEFEIARLMEENEKLKIQLQEPKIQLAPSKYERKLHIEWLQDAVMCCIEEASVTGSDVMLSSLYKRLKTADNAKIVTDFRSFKRKLGTIEFKEGLRFQKIKGWSGWNAISDGIAEINDNIIAPSTTTEINENIIAPSTTAEINENIIAPSTTTELNENIIALSSTIVGCEADVILPAELEFGETLNRKRKSSRKPILSEKLKQQKK